MGTVSKYTTEGPNMWAPD